MSDKIKTIQNHCSFCKSTDCSNLVQCLGENCGKWFCNNKNGNNGSHIYFHLKFSHHRKISIPSELPSISCSHCKKDDVYSLSVFAYKSIKEILCSDICKKSKFEVYSTRITSVIEENRISYHVLPKSDKLIAEEEKISVVDIEQLEKIWRENPDISESEAFEKLKKFKKFYLPNVRDNYESAQDLEKVFVALVEAEAWHEKQVLEKMVQRNVEVQWKTGHTEVYAELNLFNTIHFEGRLKVGDFLLISGEDIPTLKGMVKRVKEGKKLMVSFQQPKAPENIGNRYTVTPSFNGVTYKRMLEGLSDFASGQAMSPSLMLHLLGKHEEIEDSQPKKEPYTLSDCTKFERFDLNDSQKEAALKALNAAYLFLIQGPPGTGKTHTLAAIIAQAFEKLGRYAKMLVCGPSNKAIDVITKKLIQNGVTGVCRIYAVSKEKTKVDPELESVSLHKMIQEANPRLKFLMKRKENEELLSDDERDELLALKKQVEQEVIARSRVICCTCVVAGDKRLKNVIFKNVFVDEAAQATEPECLLPLLHNAEKVILCGDHKQIGPIIKSTEAKRAGFSRSLFERLIITNPDNHYMLRYQYRMHPEIAEFPSKHFYDDLLVPHHTVLQRRMKLNAPFPTDTPNFFYHIRGKEEIPVTGVSQMNRDEAQAVKKIVYTLLDSGVSPQQIGVITPYNGQKMHLTELIEQRSSLQGKIDISSVDGFQGGEKDFIIISCVRSNKEIGLGFLVDPQRLNVALTRAKYGLIVVGNAEVLRQDSNWGALLGNYSEKGHLLSGELSRLKPYKMKSQE